MATQCNATQRNATQRNGDDNAMQRNATQRHATQRKKKLTQRHRSIAHAWVRQLGQWSCRRLCPSLDIAGDWTVKGVLIYFLCTLPTFAGGFLLSVLVPNLFLMLAYSTAITVAMCNMVFPALCYLKFAAPEEEGKGKGKGNGNGGDPKAAAGAAAAHVYDARDVSAGSDEDEDEEMGRVLRAGHGAADADADADKGWAVPLAWTTLAFGAAMTLVCTVAAVGMTVIPELRGKDASFC